MTGRGDGKLLRPDANPSTVIGLSLSTSPPTLSSSSDEPFYIVVTARTLKSPNPERPVTLWTHLSPLDDLNTRGFENIKCTSEESKCIEIWPRGWPHYVWDAEDISAQDPELQDFVTVPPPGQGTVSVRHQVPPHLIRAANVQKGERYRVRMTDKCLGTNWFSFGPKDDLRGMRLRLWRSDEDEAAEEKSHENDSPELKRVLEEERKERYGDASRPTSKGEKARDLGMEREGEVEFEVV